ncbi:hypothetical protein BC937DRAFT_90623 [Endogone sp. FLAS-F59071]|nr:hypothetical protein BC937DRAFT_90623 [Endogone sp. FLAS-F59071]|eukprot:RUS16943.1 hypothetical protein BC937DRAFT_90623 [Endogone sp. FLAS-F59071]
MAIWSVEKNFVVLVFKGTSPYNLTEWLTDCTVRKSAAKNNVLPGLVHSGFYDALGFPKKSLLHKLKKKTPLESEETKPAKKHIKLTCDVYFSTKEVKTFYAEDKGAPIGNSTELCGVCEEKFWEKLFLPNLMAIGKHFRHKPNLWITGHSLGAATASVFTSVLLWHKYCNQHDNSNDQNISNDHDNSNDYDLFPQLGLADLLKNLEEHTHLGHHVSGTLSIFRECIDVARRGYNFWRFINANDIVCSVPVAVSRASNGSYCPQHHYKLFRGTEFTLNDFKHVGDPVILDFRTGKTDQRERGVADVLRGMVSEICSTEEELARGGTFLAKGFVLLNVATLGVFGMLRDHFPSEYYENFKRSLINPVIDVEIEKKNVD